MKLSRDLTRYIHFIFDELVPPILRDARWFMVPFLRLATKDKARYFINFKERAHGLSDAEFKHYYEETYGILERDTDLNQACIDEILTTVGSGSVLEVGCGNGYLLERLRSPERTLSAVDVHVSSQLRERHPEVTFYEGPLERMDFVTEQYDTVICTHTLEHVRDLPASLHHLRRVTRGQLIIVVPCQRPYRYTFDLHLSFFPYEYSLRQAFQTPPGATVELKKLSGDWYYREVPATAVGR